MDELEISGRRYISSRRAGKEHKYHPDYIGQLIRAGKVAGQKVGRSWYVDAEALAEYLGKEPAPRGPMQEQMKERIVEERVEPKKEMIAPTPVREVMREVERPAPIIEKSEEEIAPLPVRSTERENHIPLKIREEEKPAPKVNPILHSPKQGLRYVTDDEPLFPAIDRRKREPTEEEEEARAPMTVIPKHEMRPANSGAGARVGVSLGALVILGALVVALVAGGAYYLSYMMTIQGSSMSANLSFIR